MDRQPVRDFPYGSDDLEWAECRLRHPPGTKVGAAGCPARNADIHARSANDYTIPNHDPSSTNCHADCHGHGIIVCIWLGTHIRRRRNRDRWFLLVEIQTESFVTSIPLPLYARSVRYVLPALAVEACTQPVYRSISAEIQPIADSL